MDVKDDRLQIRVNPAAKRRLDQAADAAHLTLSSFVLQAAEQRADDVLMERAVISLTPAAADAFAEALERPATLNERLADALRRPKKFAWLD